MIIIAPYAQKLISGKENPKNYPYWEELIKQIDEPIIQVGVVGEKQFDLFGAVGFVADLMCQVEVVFQP